MAGKLSVDVIQAKNLIAADVSGRSDPYCVLALKGAEKVEPASHKTSVILGTLFPVWNETFVFSFPQDTDLQKLVLEVNLYDQDTLKKDDFLGKLQLPLSSVQLGHAKEYALQGVKSGRLELALSTALPDEEQDVGHTLIIHSSMMAGLMQCLDGDELRLYPTHEIELISEADVDSLPSLGFRKCHWNTGYDKAQAIFGVGNKCVALRKVIREEHDMLYRDGLFRTRSVPIPTAAALLRALHFGTREGYPRMFTYTFVGNRLLFSETGKRKTTDMMSKHAMHASCSEDVWAAGEFHIRRTQDKAHACTKPAQNYTLVLDNNSGTYAPPVDALEPLGRLLERRFPGLQVECVAMSDPKLAAYKASIAQLQVEAKAS